MLVRAHYWTCKREEKWQILLNCRSSTDVVKTQNAFSQAWLTKFGVCRRRSTPKMQEFIWTITTHSQRLLTPVPCLSRVMLMLSKSSNTSRMDGRNHFVILKLRLLRRIRRGLPSTPTRQYKKRSTSQYLCG